MRGGQHIAKATAKSKTRRARRAPAPEVAPPVERPSADTSKPIAISVGPEYRARVEQIWQTYNKESTIPASKSAIYREVLDQGIRFMETKLGIALPA